MQSAPSPAVKSSSLPLVALSWQLVSCTPSQLTQLDLQALCHASLMASCAACGILEALK